MKEPKKVGVKLKISSVIQPEFHPLFIIIILVSSLLWLNSLGTNVVFLLFYKYI
jgi:hypothetical protein